MQQCRWELVKAQQETTAHLILLKTPEKNFVFWFEGENKIQWMRLENNIVIEMVYYSNSSTYVLLKKKRKLVVFSVTKQVILILVKTSSFCLQP